VSNVDSDIEMVLSKRYDNGADFWGTPDGRIYVGNPFSTITSLSLLHELRLNADHEAVAGGLELILSAIRDDGRIRVAPKAPLYPCYTAEALRTVCRYGLAVHPSVRRCLDYLLSAAHSDGGWRCTFSRFGKGPETACASPGATLYALDALRFLPPSPERSEATDEAVDFLLTHWTTRGRIGPCHHGMGDRFFQVEYPFIRYNLFYYVYVLSFYERSLVDPRFTAALSVLRSRLNVELEIVVEQPHRRLRRLSFCAPGRPSQLATARYHEILENVASRPE